MTFLAYCQLTSLYIFLEAAWIPSVTFKQFVAFVFMRSDETPTLHRQMQANGIRIWSVAFARRGNVFRLVHQNCSNVTFWNCMWVWKLTLISVMSPFINLLSSKIYSRGQKKRTQNQFWFASMLASAVRSSAKESFRIVANNLL